MHSKNVHEQMFTGRRYECVAGLYGYFHPDDAAVNQLKTRLIVKLGQICFCLWISRYLS